MPDRLSEASRVVVIKIGGSVLGGPSSYAPIARTLADRLCERPGERILVVVSAEAGTTDALLGLARDLTGDPDSETLDLLWSTGELRSVALLTLALQARGVRAAAVNAHQTGLLFRVPPDRAEHHADARTTTLLDRLCVRPMRLRARLARADVAVAPGFLARLPGDGVASMGRGGSDLSAVLIAAALQCRACELIKDVPGYFTADPRRAPDASPIARMDYEAAIGMARNGCGLVQLHALEAARRFTIPLLVRDVHGRGTLVGS